MDPLADTSSEVYNADFLLHLEGVPELQDENKTMNNITVKFVTRNLNIITTNFTNTDQIHDIKKAVMDMFMVENKSLVLMHGSQTIEDAFSLDKIRLDKFKSVSLKILNTNIRGEIPAAPSKMCKISVHVPVTKNKYEEVYVQIYDKRIEKPNLGGYKNIRLGTVYHHGYTQTGPPQAKLDSNMLNHRSTQTCSTRNRRIQMDYHRATQTISDDIWISNTNDRTIAAKPYAPTQKPDIEKRVKMIKRYFCAWKMKKIFKEIHKEYFKRLSIENERDTLEAVEDEKRKRLYLARQVFPLKSIDFKLLYVMVNRWKLSETKRINKYYSGNARVTQLAILLNVETKLFSDIGKLQQKRREDIELAEMKEFFKTMGKPLEWYSSYKNIHITMDTLEIQKGREMYAFFERVTNKNQSVKERIQNLMELRLFLSESKKCNETKDVLDLVERALIMLTRGINDKHLQMLYKRIEGSFLNYINRDFNVSLRKIRKTSEGKTNKLIYCGTCEKLKPIAAFPTKVKVASLTCSACLWTDEVQAPCIDLSPYHFILNQIRNYERQHLATSSAAFIMQVPDMPYLIDIIWHCQSALSECDDIYKLRMCRWRKEEDWSPWNCILLTGEEAKIHLLVDRLEDVYEKEFFNHIFCKHSLARCRFAKVKRFEEYFREYSEDTMLQENYWTTQSQHCLKINEGRQTLQQSDDAPLPGYFDMLYKMIGGSPTIKS